MNKKGLYYLHRLPIVLLKDTFECFTIVRTYFYKSSCWLTMTNTLAYYTETYTSKLENFIAVTHGLNMELIY
jgi:hypothetical protein